MIGRFKGWWVAGVLCVLLLPIGSVFNHKRLNAQLLYAAGEIDLPAVERLLAKGSEVNTRGEFEETPLHRVAVSEDHFSYGRPDDSGIIKFLVARGGDLNARNFEGDTPLHCAIYARGVKAVNALLKNGANVNAWSPKHGSPLKTAKTTFMQESSVRNIPNMRDMNKIIHILKVAGARE